MFQKYTDNFGHEKSVIMIQLVLRAELRRYNERFAKTVYISLYL